MTPDTNPPRNLVPYATFIRRRLERDAFDPDGHFWGGDEPAPTLMPGEAAPIPTFTPANANPQPEKRQTKRPGEDMPEIGTPVTFWNASGKPVRGWVSDIDVSVSPPILTVQCEDGIRRVGALIPTPPQTPNERPRR